MADPVRERAGLEDRLELQLDLRLQDPAALEEIELYSELIIVAGASDEPLSHAEIDRALGLAPAAEEKAPARRRRVG
jgi:hypothetical protein